MHSNPLFIVVLTYLGLIMFLVVQDIDTDGNSIPLPATVTVTLAPEWTEPYGGCKEAARYPRSTGYAECQQHGLLP